MEGKLIIFSAPSGSGKTTILRMLLQLGLNLGFSISACTRLPRQNEKDGVDYYFMPAETFQKKIEEGAFIEWEEVYPGQYYGTLKSELDRIWGEGNHVVFDIDVAGGLNLKKIFNEKALAVFISPPSVQELEKRLRFRNTDSEESIKKRVAKAEYELTFADKFDRILINNDFNVAVNEAYEMITRFLNTP